MRHGKTVKLTLVGGVFPSRSCVAVLRYLYIKLLNRIERLTAHGDDATDDPEDESKADTAPAHCHVRRGHEDAGAWERNTRHVGRRQ